MYNNIFFSVTLVLGPLAKGKEFWPPILRGSLFIKNSGRLQPVLQVLAHDEGAGWLRGVRGKGLRFSRSPLPVADREAGREKPSGSP